MASDAKQDTRKFASCGHCGSKIYDGDVHRCYGAGFVVPQLPLVLEELTKIRLLMQKLVDRQSDNAVITELVGDKAPKTKAKNRETRG
jgi:hypothetical protein